MKRCSICGRQAAREDEGLNFCLDHHLEFSLDAYSFISRYCLEKTMSNNGFRKCSITRKWVIEVREIICLED